MKIIYNDLCIRNAEDKDCEQLATWWNDGSVMAHASFPNGLETTAEKIKEQIANDNDNTKRRLIIEFRGHQSAKYFIDKSVWRKILHEKSIWNKLF